MADSLSSFRLAGNPTPIERLSRGHALVFTTDKYCRGDFAPPPAFSAIVRREIKTTSAETSFMTTESLQNYAGSTR